MTTNRSKHYLKCHLIFVCKYRKKLLTGQLNDDVKQILKSIANNSDFEIEYWYKNVFWSDGYFVCSIGEASPNTIGEYILSQG